MDLLANEGYRIVYVPHHIIEDYNATYNVDCQGKHIITNAARKLEIPLGEIWISELWKLYSKFILFHELREILHRACGIDRDEAHEQAIRDSVTLWKDDSLWQKMVMEIGNKDSETAKRRRRSSL